MHTNTHVEQVEAVFNMSFIALAGQFIRENGIKGLVYAAKFKHMQYTDPVGLRAKCFAAECLDDIMGV